MVAVERHGSTVILERRPSSRQDATRGSRKPASRVSVAPIHTAKRSPRLSLLASSLGFAGTGTSTTGGHGAASLRQSVSEQFETAFDTPSPTASRLRSLARSVRAAQVLGTLKVGKQYLASSPMAATGANDLSDDGDNGNGAGGGTRSSVVNAMTPSRVIVLSTHEFSTDEMKFRLDPLEPTSSAGSWDKIHGLLDALPSSTGSTPPPARAQTATSSATATATAATHPVKTARSGSISSGAIPTPGDEAGDKMRWKPAATKSTLPASGSSNNHNHNNSSNSTAASTAAQSPLMRRGASNSAGTKRILKRNSSILGMDATSLLGFGPSATSAQDASQLTDSLAGGKPNLEARLRCARSLYKLSCQAGCELAIIQGGAIAQLVEISDIEHVHLHELCAATLANLTSDPAAIDAFVARDGIPALLELSWSHAISVKKMCATALCRLSARAAHAATLAKCRASIEFLAMLSLPVEQLQTLAISCIVNLIYFGHSFPDRVFLGDPHALQNQAGILSVTSQLASATTSMHFAAEVLFNLALYRTSCSGALRGGGADIVHALAVHVGKTLDEHHFAGSSNSSGLGQQTPRMPLASAMTLLRLIAHTLANFSAHVEFHAMTSGSAMKTLAILLFGALRDLGSRFYGGFAEERLRILAVPCSRALANLSSNQELRTNGFSADMVQLTARLFLVNRTKLFSMVGVTAKRDETSFARNILCAVVNLSFDEQCTAQLMEFPDVMPRLTRLVLRGKNGKLDEEFHDEEDDENRDSDDDDDDTDDDDDDDDGCGDRDDRDESERAIDKTRDHTESPGANPTLEALALAETRSQMKEEALVAILNLAQQGAYSQELLKHLDGKRLAQAAEGENSGSRLKYIYDVVLSNMLFETRLQQIVYGDLVVNSLVDGFYFFQPPNLTAAARSMDPFSPDGGAALAFQTGNLAFPDDQERFLSAIVTIAGELMDSRNIERLVALALDCIRPMDLSLPPAHRKRRKNITCLGAAILHTLARASAQRSDTSSRIFSSETVCVLIAVCERQATHAEPVTEASGGPVTYCATTQAYCAATLYHLCATHHFTPRVIHALIAACNSNEESQSLLACSAAFAIISFTYEGRQQLVACADLAKALNRLGRTSQVECQQYAAVAACNVSTLQCIWPSKELKDFIVVALLRANSVQAKQIHAKTLANLLSHIKTRAKAVEDGVLYALMKLSHVMISTDAPTSGADESTSSPSNHRPLTAGAPSSQKPLSPKPIVSNSQTPKPQPDPMDEVFHLGLQVLFNLSCEPQYHQKLMGNGVMAYLATAVVSNSKQPTTGKENPLRLVTPTNSSSLLPAADLYASHTQPLAPSVSTESRRFAMGIICNLTSYEINHKELMNAQVVDLIRSYVDHDVETRASAAMAVRNLSCRQPWVEMVCERRTLQMMIHFTHCDHAVVRHFAIQALANCSQVTDSLHLFGELKVTRAVMSVLDSIRPPAGSASSAAAQSPTKPPRPLPLAPSASLADAHETSMAALKCLHNMAADDTLAANLMGETAILRLLPIMESRELDRSEEACGLAATMISVLAGKPRCAEALLKQRVVGFCALLHRKHPMHVAIAYECAVILMKLSTFQSIQAALTETQAIQVVVAICSSPCACVDPHIRECGAIAIRNLTLCVAEQLSVFYDDAGFDEADVLAPGKTIARSQEQNGSDRVVQNRRNEDSEPLQIHRLTERHLLQGVQFFQDELQRFLPDPADATKAPSCRLSERILMEACAGLANLSTVKTFRVAMVRQGVVPTLLRVFQVGRLTDGVPPIVRSMCCATLHRLALEDDATVDGHGLLVPSLLEILQQSDEELHQVRYECEKVSLPPTSAVATTHGCVRTSAALSSSSPLLRRTGSSSSGSDAASMLRVASNSTPGSVAVVAAAAASVTTGEKPSVPPHTVALVATTTCVKQTYREPKWIAYVVKTMLSSSAMVPTLEKKQIRSIGQPKLSYFDIDATTLFASSATTTTASPSDPVDDGVGDQATSSRKGGYILPVHMEKYTSHLASCVQDSAVIRDDDARLSLDGSGGGGSGYGSQQRTARSSVSSLSSSRDATGGGGAQDRESLVHSRKFDRHMQLTRRNHRRTNVLPVLSFT